MNKTHLLAIREVQGQTGPNMCLASSKFLALKLMGLVDQTKHLNDFLHSPWAHKNASLPLAACWGGSMAEHNAMFNEKVLPAAVNEPTADVCAGGGKVNFHTGFTFFFDNRSRADMMLNQRTPLIVGVSLHGGHARDHFIVIFKDRNARVWAVDPWPGIKDNAVVELESDLSFQVQTRVHLTADAVATEFPCRPAFFGSFA